MRNFASLQRPAVVIIICILKQLEDESRIAVVKVLGQPVIGNQSLDLPRIMEGLVLRIYRLGNHLIFGKDDLIPNCSSALRQQCPIILRNIAELSSNSLDEFSRCRTIRHDASSQVPEVQAGTGVLSVWMAGTIEACRKGRPGKGKAPGTR